MAAAVTNSAIVTVVAMVVTVAATYADSAKTSGLIRLRHSASCTLPVEKVEASVSKITLGSATVAAAHDDGSSARALNGSTYHPTITSSKETA